MNEIFQSGLREPKGDRRDLSRHLKFGSIDPSLLPPAGLGRPRARTENQRPTNFCTGYTAAGMREAKYGFRFSPEWICAQEAKLEGYTGGYFAGAQLRTQAKVVSSIGILKSEDAPYSWQKDGMNAVILADLWPETLKDKSRQYKSSGFFKVDGPHDMYDNIRIALAMHDSDNEGVSVAMKWRYEDWNGIGNDGVLPKPTSGAYSPHNVRIYDWDEQGLICDPHLGPEWGDEGLCYLSREIADSEIYDIEGPYLFLDGIDVDSVKAEQWGFLEIIKNWLVKVSAWLSKPDVPLPPAPFVPAPQPIDNVPLPPLPDVPPPHVSRIKDWAKVIEEMENMAKYHAENNNPGALRNSPFQNGVKNGYATFVTYEMGWKALIHQLSIAANGQSKVYKPTDSLLQFFAKYAPAIENQPEKYAEFVASSLKISIDTPIKDLL